MNTQTTVTLSGNEFANTLRNSGVNSVRPNKTDKVLNSAFGLCAKTFANLVPTGQVNEADFKVSKKLINAVLRDEDTEQLPGTWHTIKHNGKVVFTFFKLDTTAAPLPEVVPTTDELFENFKKHTNDWIYNTLNALIADENEAAKEIVPLLIHAAWQRKHKVVQIEEQPIFFWVQGNVTSGCAFAELSDVMAGLPLFALNSNCNLSNIEASFEIVQKTLEKSEVTTEVEQTSDNVAPTFEEVGSLLDKLGHTSFEVLEIKPKHDDTNKVVDYSIRFTIDKRPRTKLYSSLVNEVTNLS